MPSSQPEPSEPTSKIDQTLSKRNRRNLPPVPSKATVATLLRKGPVDKRKDELEPPHDTMPLKGSGEWQEIRKTRSRERRLCELLDREPELFDALRSVIEGHGENVSKAQIRELRERGFVTRDREYSVHPHIKSTMEAAFRQTGDGPCIVDPLDVRTSEQAETVRSVEGQSEEQEAERMVRLFDSLKRRPGDSDKQKGGNRSR